MSKNFIEVPCLTFNAVEQEQTGKEADQCELMECARKVDPSRIESYRECVPTSDFREDNKIWTQVVMDSGDHFIVNIPMEEFEKQLQAHFEAISLTSKSGL